MVETRHVIPSPPPGAVPNLRVQNLYSLSIYMCGLLMIPKAAGGGWRPWQLSDKRRGRKYIDGRIDAMYKESFIICISKGWRDPLCCEPSNKKEGPGEVERINWRIVLERRIRRRSKLRLMRGQHQSPYYAINDNKNYSQ